MLGDRKDYDEKLKAISGIIFLDVPSLGMDISSLKLIVGSGPNQAFLMTLEHGNIWLEQLSTRFYKAIDWNMDMVAFYAMQKSPTAEQKVVQLPYRNTRIYQAVH